MTRAALLLFILPIIGYAQRGPINIHLKSGKVLSTTYASLENNAGLRGPYVRINDRKGERISIREVDHIEGTDQHGTYRFFKPIKLNASEIWGERTFQTDRVSMFYTNVINGGTTFYKFKYFQYTIDDQPLKKMNYANLKADISNNTDSRALLKKGNGLRAAQLLIYGLGASLVIGGMSRDLNSTNDGGKIPPMLVAGVVCLWIPLALDRPKQNHFLNALKIYK